VDELEVGNTVASNEGSGGVASGKTVSSDEGSSSGKTVSSDEGSSGNTDSVVGNSDGGGNGVLDLLDGVGPGLVHDRLVDGLVGPDGAGDGDRGVDRDVLEDGLGSVVGPHNGVRLEGGNLGGDVGVRGLGHRVGDGRDLGHNIGVRVSLSSRVGKVAAKTLVHNGGRVVGGGAHAVGNGAGDSADQSGARGDRHGAGAGESDQGGEEQEGVHVGWLFL